MLSRSGVGAVRVRGGGAGERCGGVVCARKERNRGEGKAAVWGRLVSPSGRKGEGAGGVLGWSAEGERAG